MLPRIVFLLTLLFFLQAAAQLDMRKLDSLSRSIDSSAKATRTSIDSISRTLDSMMRADTRKKTVQPSTIEEEVKTSKGKWLVMTLAGVAILGSILFFLYKKNRKTS
jgi:LPXTG-motif cell wall-anchored protein